jgi:hypothetical protein
MSVKDEKNLASRRETKTTGSNGPALSFYEIYGATRGRTQAQSTMPLRLLGGEYTHQTRDWIQMPDASETVRDNVNQ